MALECYRDAQYSLLPAASPAAVGPRMVLPLEVLWHPDATRRPLASDMGGALTLSRGLILHVQEGDNSPYPWFARPDVKASSHWWVSRSGALEQFVPADRAAWAQAGGNGAWHSVETEGFHGEGLTHEQVATLGRLYAWGHDRWGWAFDLADKPSAIGLGWHGMGGAAWGSHPGCPGELRKSQRPQIITAAIGDEQEEVMPTPQEYAKAVWEYPPPPDNVVDRHIQKPNMGAVSGESYNKAGALQTGVKDLAAKVGAIGAALQTLVGPDHPAAAALVAQPALTLDDLRAAVPGLGAAEAVALAEAAITRAGVALAEERQASR